jgi:hypothetical protein
MVTLIYLCLHRELQEGVHSPTDENAATLEGQPTLLSPGKLQGLGAEHLVLTERPSNMKAKQPHAKGGVATSASPRALESLPVPSISKDLGHSDSLLVRSHLRSILEETRNSLDSLSNGLKQHTTTVLQVGPMHKPLRAGRKVSSDTLLTGKEKGGSREWAEEREGFNRGGQVRNC